MGGSTWSSDAYDYVEAPRAAMPVDDVKRTVFRSKHIDAALDPNGVKVRESRDSDNHPESNAIAVLFDVTGSMGQIPARFAQEKLGRLMKVLTSKGVIPHPQVLFGAIGDSYSDQAPLQIGQFESGLEMDDWLTKIWIEGNGGGQIKESYALAHYFAARHTSIDCFEKRGKKGYLFTLGDELVHPFIKRDEALKIFGDRLEADLTAQDLIAEAQRSYEVFHIVVGGTSHGDEPQILNGWRDLLGERALYLKDPDAVCELIATTIALVEGHSLDATRSVLLKNGASASAVAAASTAIIPFSQSTALVRGKAGSAEGKLAKPAGASGGVQRL